jgi:hypothetical protein
MLRQGHGAHVQRRENEAGYFRSTRTRHPKNSGDSSQALTANSNNTTSYGKNVGCIQDGEEIQQSEDKTTPRSCGIVALKAPQPQSTLTRYYTFTTKRNHEAHKILNADQISLIALLAFRQLGAASSVLRACGFRWNPTPKHDDVLHLNLGSARLSAADALKERPVNKSPTHFVRYPTLRAPQRTLCLCVIFFPVPRHP